VKSAAERHLQWEGCFNVRELGGFPTRSGGTTAWGAVVRSDSPAALTEQGWAALRAHGIRTIVDLRDPIEREELPPLAELDAVHAPVLDLGDDAFFEPWRGTWDTPRFYRAVLAHWQDRFTAAVVAVARAEPGGVLVHCQVGRDRTGLVTAMLLSLAGVPAAEIAADYALSAERLRPLYDRLAAELEDESARARLHRENASEASWMLDLLGELDVEAYLLAGGATAEDLAAARRRLLDL
jgi:protein tyrosine/serine phosphatase